jgi:hypothetical protein
VQELVVRPFGKHGTPAILAFDGRVLEVFGFSEVERYHVFHLRIDFLEPRRDGSIPMRIVGPGRSLTMSVGPGQLDEVREFLEPIGAGSGPPPDHTPVDHRSPVEGGTSASLNEPADPTGLNVRGAGLVDVAELARSGQTLEAVKRYRALTGASYSEAQAYITTL